MTKPREEFLNQALACGAVLTGKPDGSEPVTVVFSTEAWHAFDAANKAIMDIATQEHRQMHLAACISNGTLYAYAVHNQGSDGIVVLAGARMNLEDLQKADSIAAMRSIVAQDVSYAWSTIEDYEKDVGFEVGMPFKMGWNMARTTNGFLHQLAMGKKDRSC